MKNSNNNETTNDSNSFSNKTQNKVRQLLGKLNSPLLFIASELLQPKTPEFPLSVQTRSIAVEVESLSKGCFYLTQDQQLPEPKDEYYQYRLLKVRDRFCGHISYVSLNQLKYLGTDSCAYCCKPLSLKHIGSKTEIQEYLLAKTNRRVFFNQRNTIEDADLSDLFSFNCIPCGGRSFESPLTWVIDTPWAGCPCCEAKFCSQTN